MASPHAVPVFRSSRDRRYMQATFLLLDDRIGLIHSCLQTARALPAIYGYLRACLGHKQGRPMQQGMLAEACFVGRKYIS